MQETILLLRQQLESLISDNNLSPQQQNLDCRHATLDSCSQESFELKNDGLDWIPLNEAKDINERTPTSVMSINKVFSEADVQGSREAFLNTKLLMQVN